jgi:hypothetical protein
MRPLRPEEPSMTSDRPAEPPEPEPDEDNPPEPEPDEDNPPEPVPADPAAPGPPEWQPQTNPSVPVPRAVSDVVLSDVISARIGVDKRTADEAAKTVLDVLIGRLAVGEKVAIAGYGVFEKLRQTSAVAERGRITVVCDLPHDGEVEAVETIRFGFNGTHYEINVCAAHAKELRERFARYIDHGRRVTSTGSKKRRRKSKSTSVHEPRLERSA